MKIFYMTSLSAMKHLIMKKSLFLKKFIIPMFIFKIILTIKLFTNLKGKSSNQYHLGTKNDDLWDQSSETIFETTLHSGIQKLTKEIKQENRDELRNKLIDGEKKIELENRIAARKAASTPFQDVVAERKEARESADDLLKKNMENIEKARREPGEDLIV
ncbi:hypothetical protein EDEG_00379 [Edhazardia aedis USNM 41457]|uniref:Uncharacterized protein n=1 Tax=Edhazardia aedis (strain USNM 41457) TaxID=1003232 RepID=J8ZQ17_EDHAE|nr:hypothetical protein EDEG_00379 [Edhazardia aedis USNM 41457]|eukprot:EJW01788.1 hypothetical protein EDEG_00379 [Edhazardia aedis USNM 41457]